MRMRRLEDAGLPRSGRGRGNDATIVKVMPKARGRKKFADVGLVPGTELLMEAHAPFGGLIRVKIMETSMALHSDDAANIVLKKEA